MRLFEVVMLPDGTLGTVLEYESRGEIVQRARVCPDGGEHRHCRGSGRVPRWYAAGETQATGQEWRDERRLLPGERQRLRERV